jgi:hypothetical protein
MKKNASIIALFLAACQAPFLQDAAPESSNKRIGIQTLNKINDGMALRIDIVQVYKKELFETLKRMSAKNFREKRTEFLTNNPGEFIIWTFDMLEEKALYWKLPAHKNYLGVIIFIHFNKEGNDKIVVPKENNCWLLTISQGKAIFGQDSSKKKYEDLTYEGKNVNME